MATDVFNKVLSYERLNDCRRVGRFAAEVRNAEMHIGGWRRDDVNEDGWKRGTTIPFLSLLHKQPQLRVRAKEISKQTK